MDSDFSFEILTPAKGLFTARVTEVVLPGFDGEVGVLPGHEDFIGLLGTGPLKIVKNGDDFWFMVSSGLYQIEKGALRVLAEIAEDAASVSLDGQTEKLKTLEAQVADHQNFTFENYPDWKTEYDKVRARIEIHRRTQLVN